MVKSVNTNKVEKDKKVAIAVVFENPEFGKIMLFVWHIIRKLPICMI